MKNKVTIHELYVYVKSVLLKTENLETIYIGKTSNPESAESRHQKDFDKTQVVAIGKPDIISKAENYSIKHLKADLSCIVEVDNQNEGSAGNPNANMLYVSWEVRYININQLNEPDFNDEPFELIS